jgi:CelD/BcsL family acetyltransferase involved in cellulose biosynthesis
MFTEPAWLQTCLACWPVELGWTHRRFQPSEQAAGQCLLGRQTLRRPHGLFSSRVLALNQSLAPQWDQVFVEFNGFFDAPSSCFPTLFAQALSELQDDPDWEEFRLPGLRLPDAEHARRLAGLHGLRARTLDQRPAWHRQLAEDRQAGSILAGLSANTRQQIRRSRRALETSYGPLRLMGADSAGQAQQWFDAMAPWHRQRWSPEGAASGSSGFDNPSFVRFHRELIERAFAQGQIRLWRVLSGDRIIAMLYNFRVADTEAFYLGATDPALDPAMRPGLVAHQCAMDQCLSEGLSVYDFMAGDSQYKRQLSNRKEELLWLVLQRPRLKFRLEDALRALRQRYRTAVRT